MIDKEFTLQVALYLIESYKNSTLVSEFDKDRLSKVEDIIKRDQFKVSPASTKFHNKFEGGLLFHSLKVTLIMLSIKYYLQIDVSDVSCLICGFLHDLTKVDEYIHDIQSDKFYRNSRASYPELMHAQKSLKLIELEGIQLTYDEELAIANHMGPFGIEASQLYKSWELDSLAFVMHMADVIDSKNLDKGKIIATYVKQNENGLTQFISNK